MTELIVTATSRARAVPPWLCRLGLHSWRRSTADAWLWRCERRFCHAYRGSRRMDAWGRPR